MLGTEKCSSRNCLIPATVFLTFTANRGCPAGLEKSERTCHLPGGDTWVNFCWVCAADLSEPTLHHSHFWANVWFLRSQLNLVTFYSCIYLILYEEHFTFDLQYKHSGTFANRKYEELSYAKTQKMCDPMPVTLLKMRPHYSQTSRENATPSSGTSPRDSISLL